MPKLLFKSTIPFLLGISIGIFGLKQSIDNDSTQIGKDQQVIGALQDQVRTLRYAALITNSWHGVILNSLQQKVDGLTEIGLVCPALVFRFRNSHCPSCIDENIDLLKDLATGLPNCTVAIFVDGYGPRQLYAWQIRLLEWNLYVLDVDTIEPDSITGPYYFILSNGFRASRFFVPTLGDTAMVRSYLSSVAKDLR